MPSGGTTGQVLVKNTTADYDTGWGVAPYDEFAPTLYEPGGWYDNRLFAANPLSSGTGGYVVVVPAGNSYYLPIWLSSAVTIDRLSIQNNTVATTGTLGLSACNPSTGNPAALLTSATINMSTTGAVGITTNVSLNAGWFFVVLYLATSSTLAGASTYLYRSPVTTGTTTMTTPGSELWPAGLLSAGAIPASSPTGVWKSGLGYPPIVWFRVV